MATLTVTFDKTSYTPGALVTMTVVEAPTRAKPDVVTVTDPSTGATGTGTVVIIPPLTVTDSTHSWVKTSDDGATAVYTTTA